MESLIIGTDTGIESREGRVLLGRIAQSRLCRRRRPGSLLGAVLLGSGWLECALFLVATQTTPI